jgi:hypothetical protein
MMKTQLFAALLACVSFGWAQADIPLDWNTSFTTDGKIGIYHPIKSTGYEATIMVDYGGQVYTTHLQVAPDEWGFAKFPEDFGFSYEDMPDGTGTIQANVVIQAEGDIIYNQELFLTARNRAQPYEVDIDEIGDRINYYGDQIDDCIFYIDNLGYNYVIRSRNTNRSGIFLAHWVMDVSGGTERISYYKNTETCSSGQVQTQYHSIGWALEDENQDGYCEFYTMLFDACEETHNHPQDATLHVLTNIPNLALEGQSYSLADDPNIPIGGDYKATSELSKHSMLLAAAEAAWEVYIME